MLYHYLILSLLGEILIKNIVVILVRTENLDEEKMMISNTNPMIELSLWGYFLMHDPSTFCHEFNNEVFVLGGENRKKRLWSVSGLCQQKAYFFLYVGFHYRRLFLGKRCAKTETRNCTDRSPSNHRMNVGL